MKKYLTLFNSHAEYEQYVSGNFEKPNVSHCVQEDDVHYNPWVETRLVTKFNVTSTTETTHIINATRNISGVEIDGVQQSSVDTYYKFSTTGEHTVKFTLDESSFYKNELYENQFNTCSALTSIVIPTNITKIDNRVFRWCFGLTSVTIPDSVTSIGENVFDYCSGLTSVMIPDSVTSIGGYAFELCYGLTTITIPDSVTSIGQYAFQYCSGLTSVTIGSGVTSIGDSAFYACTSLTSVTIPSSVTRIYASAFRTCSGLTSIIVEPETPPTIVSNTFDNTNNCPIYVPSASVETYKTTTNWSNYATRIQAIPQT